MPGCKECLRIRVEWVGIKPPLSSCQSPTTTREIIKQSEQDRKARPFLYPCQKAPVDECDHPDRFKAKK